MGKKKRKGKRPRNGIGRKGGSIRVDFDTFAKFIATEVRGDPMVRDNLAGYVRQFTESAAQAGIPPLLGQFMWSGLLLTALALRMATPDRPPSSVSDDLAEVARECAIQQEASLTSIHNATLAAFKHQTGIFMDSPEEIGKYFVKEFGVDPMDMGQSEFSSALMNRLKGYLPYLPGAFYGTNQDLLNALDA